MVMVMSKNGFIPFCFTGLLSLKIEFPKEGYDSQVNSCFSAARVANNLGMLGFT